MPSSKQVFEQLSLVAEAVRALRSPMETVSIDRSQRQRLKLKSTTTRFRLKELLGWLEYFATEQGRVLSRVARDSPHTR